MTGAGVCYWLPEYGTVARRDGMNIARDLHGAKLGTWSWDWDVVFLFLGTPGRLLQHQSLLKAHR